MNKTKSFVISKIDWTLDKEFHFGVEKAKYIETLINTNNNYLPLKNSQIQFTDNKWDFRPYYPMKNTSDLTFNFNNIPNSFLVLSKFFILLSLLNSKQKASSINRRFQDIKKFLIYLDASNITSITNVFPVTVNNYMATKDISPKTEKMIYIALKYLFEFIYANYSYDLNLKISFLEKKMNELQKIVKKTNQNNKTPNIPKDYYNKLISLLIKSMRNKDLEYKDRSIACLYIILSQTGLRIGEVVSLETNSLKSIKLDKIESTAYFLTYKVFKSTGKELGFTQNEIFANKLTKEAFDTLIDLRETRANKEGNNFIYLPNTKTLPSPTYLPPRHFYSFLFRHAPFSTGKNSPYPELTVKKNNNQYIFAPTTKQFRVKVCTDLYYNNIPLLYIKKYMSHLSDEMIAYYVRPKNKQLEEVKYSKKLIKKLIKNEVKILGDNASELEENVSEFIKKSEFNIQRDLDKIIDSLNGKLVIRAKRTGVCIKTSIRECAKDARTNELFCAYDICPNLFHLYYMADISYEDFKSTQKTFLYNKKNNFKLQASKELNKAKSICKRRLMPELKDLKEKIKGLGIDNILKSYPNLKEIIQNYDAIKEEIELWMKKKY